MENNFQMVVNRSLSDGIVTIANGRSSSVTHASTSSVHVTASPLAHDISTRSLANQIQHMNILDCKFANTNNHKHLITGQYQPASSSRHQFRENPQLQKYQKYPPRLLQSSVSNPGRTFHEDHQMMKTRDQMALLGLIPAINPQPKLTPPGNIMAAHPVSPVNSNQHYSNPGQWNPAMINPFHASQTSPTLFSAVVANHGKHPNAWGVASMSDSSSPGGSSMGSYPISPVLQNSPVSPPTSSPVFDANVYLHHINNQSKPRSMVSGRTCSPIRPKSLEQKSVLNGVQNEQQILAQEEYQDFEESQNGSRPKSESEKEKVWKQKPERYKTELCRAYEDHNWCKYGSRCQFAHGQTELRQVEKHPKFKTQLCNAYHSTGYCKYGSRCHFVHNVEESRVPNPQIASPNSGMSRQNSEDQPQPDMQQKVPEMPRKNMNKVEQRLMQPKGTSVEISVEMPHIPDGYIEAKENMKQREIQGPVTPIGTPIKSDLSPYDITKEHFIGSSFLNKQTLASIWHHPESSSPCGFNSNNNAVFSFLPKNLLEL